MKVGIKGISYSATERKYLVRVIKNSKRVYLGRYSSLEEAREALNKEQGGMPTATQEEMPILSSIRAEFAPKKNKTVKNAALSKATKTPQSSKTTVLGNKTTHMKMNEKKPNKTTNETGKGLFESIVSYLLKEADSKETSVFNIVVEHIARLSKKT